MINILNKLYNHLYSFVTATPVINDDEPVRNYNLMSIEKLLYQARKSRGHQSPLDILYDNTNKETTDVV